MYTFKRISGASLEDLADSLAVNGNARLGPRGKFYMYL